jgi:hypothetical protein
MDIEEALEIRREKERKMRRWRRIGRRTMNTLLWMVNEKDSIRC